MPPLTFNNRPNCAGLLCGCQAYAPAFGAFLSRKLDVAHLALDRFCHLDQSRDVDVRAGLAGPGRTHLLFQAGIQVKPKEAMGFTVSRAFV